MTPEQAQAASAALMAAELAEQAARHARSQQRRRSRLRWSGAAALIGMGIGGLAGHWLSGHVLPWNLLGLGLGALAGYLKDARAG